jgi:serine/threonine protein kinase
MRDSETHIQAGDYFITKKIGKGSFSNVYKAYHKDTKELYGIKIVDVKDLADKILENLNSEIEILLKINHQNILRLHGTFKSPSCVYLVLEYCDGGDLHNYIKKFTRIDEKTTAHLFTQAANGLYYLWSNKLIHRDIKPGNLLITTDGVVKITDFGIAEQFDIFSNSPMNCQSFSGTHQFLAPEVVTDESEIGYDGTKGFPNVFLINLVDIWACGVVLYYMLSGNLPFEFNSELDLSKLHETIALGAFKMPTEAKNPCDHLLLCN